MEHYHQAVDSALVFEAFAAFILNQLCSESDLQQMNKSTQNDENEKTSENGVSDYFVYQYPHQSYVEIWQLGQQEELTTLNDCIRLVQLMMAITHNGCG